MSRHAGAVPLVLSVPWDASNYRFPHFFQGDNNVTQVLSTITINAAGDAIWEVLGAFGSAGDYLPGVIDCTAEGAGIGMRRTLIGADGGMIVERLEALDETARRLSYALLSYTPFGDCMTTLAVRELGPNRAELTWSATFEPDGIPADEAADLMEDALATNCLALKQLFER